MNHRWRFIPLLIVIVLALLLAACGGDDNDKPSGGDTPGNASGDASSDASGNTGGSTGDEATSTAAPTTRPPTNTPYPPAPRERPEPEGDPAAFEPPFSIGDFVRESLRGNVTAVTTGGLQAIYRHENDTIVLKIYHFNQTSNAVATVEDALHASNIVAEIDTIYASPSINYGIVQDKHGAYVAAWNNYRWTFIATTPASLDTLNAFLKLFQY